MRQRLIGPLCALVLGLALYVSAPVHANQTPPKGPAERTLTLDKESAYDKICFEKDCLPLPDLKELVAKRNELSQQAQLAQSMQQALATKIDDLGKCQGDLGPLQRIQAAVIRGDLADPKDMAVRFRQALERANPTVKFGPDLKIMADK